MKVLSLFYLDSQRQCGVANHCKACERKKVLKHHKMKSNRLRIEQLRENRVLGVKRCSRCKETLPVDKFRDRKGSTDGKEWQCRQCESISDKLIKYDITHDTYDRLKNRSGGKCEICGNSPDKLAIDHCHSSGKVRGMLCKSCNTGLGNLRDNISLLERAIEYLKTRG